MTITCDQPKTRGRVGKLERYLTNNVLGADFVCPHHHECRASHPGRFYEGQLHHVGRFYDLQLDATPVRVVVVGQEYGQAPPRVSCHARHDMLMSSALDHRFKAGDGFKARNPHMRGTTNVLRLLYGIPLGTDHDSEFMMIGGERVHIFNAFDRMIRISYEHVSRYALHGQSGERCTAATFHGDIFTHEVRVTDAGHTVHEIAFEAGSVFSIECEDFTVADEPVSENDGKPS